MSLTAIVVAAGQGTRLGGPIPKQYQRLGGTPVLALTVRALLAEAAVTRLVVAIHPEAGALYDAAMQGLSDPRIAPPVHGGPSRAETVHLTLESLDGPDTVMIHDAARPFVGRADLAEMIRLAQAGEASMLAEPVVDALWREDGVGAGSPVPRAGLWRAQTPQCFPFAALLAAHRAEAGAETPALDDTEVFRRAGGRVRLLPGPPENFKITTAADMARAQRLIAEETPMDIRTGHGFDVHRFRDGDHVWLCGVQIPHGRALDGHSDADVGLHALSDAIYGALAEGDIGRHFPPSDPQWKGAESHVFLSHAAGLVTARGGRIGNADVTLLCEAPKIAPHADAMRTRMAEIMGIGTDRVSVKATTMERMGFIGREEGIGAIATATVILPGA